MNTDQLHADTRSCGEMSCEECNERTEALRNEIARLTSELSALQTECDHLRITRAEFKRKVSDVEAENAALREEREWRNIATAPKDGTKILVADIDDGMVFEVVNGYFEVLEDDEGDGPWDIRDGKPWCSYEGRGAGTYFCSWLPCREFDTRTLVTPNFGYTHWLPLPQPPALADDVKPPLGSPEDLHPPQGP